MVTDNFHTKVAKERKAEPFRQTQGPEPARGEPVEPVDGLAKPRAPLNLKIRHSLGGRIPTDFP
jgi:hypothetical protein